MRNHAAQKLTLLALSAAFLLASFLTPASLRAGIEETPSSFESHVDGEVLGPATQTPIDDLNQTGPSFEPIMQSQESLGAGERGAKLNAVTPIFPSITDKSASQKKNPVAAKRISAAPGVSISISSAKGIADIVVSASAPDAAPKNRGPFARLKLANLKAAVKRGVLGRLTRFATPGQAFSFNFDAGDSSDPGIPPNFGAPDGTEISNKNEILNQIDGALGENRPPALEVVWVRPRPIAKLRKRNLAANPFGHILVRYTMPDGTQKMLNIIGLIKGHRMVNFLKPEDYLYSTHGFILPSHRNSPDYQERAQQQGGAYNLGMISTRIETLPDETLLRLDAYYQHLWELEQQGKIKYAMFDSHIRNAVNWFKRKDVRYGNCAQWVSQGLVHAGILKSEIFWPKKIWIEIYEKYRALDPDNVHVVSYRRIRHAVQTFSWYANLNGLVTLWNWAENTKYQDPERFADVIVDVPKGSTAATPRAQGPK